MKNKTNFKKGSYLERFLPKFTIKSIVLIAFSALSIQTTLQAQETEAQKTEIQETEYTRPTWKFGVAVGANFNFYQGSTQQLNADFMSPAAFHDGNGVGLYVAPVIEFQRPNSLLGVMLQAGYDNRKGNFQTIETPCNCPADLDANISYITIEPSLRLAPFKSDFYIYAGPRFAFSNSKSFTYQLGINPAYPDQAPSAAVEGDFGDVNETLISMQIGAGYDVQLSPTTSKTQFILSPFVSYHPYFGQNPRSVETWNVTTIRAGAVLKFGMGRKIQKMEAVVETPEEVVVVIAAPEVEFSVVAPVNAPAVAGVREFFPLRNYVFFDLGSTKIPGRYKLLKKDEVKSFREDQLDMGINESGRSNRQMDVYYNVINILGERMVEYPKSSINLVGSSEKGAADAKKMAESVKVYLVNVFGIDAARISTKGQIKPDKPSTTVGGTKELDLLHEGDRRVSIESSSAVLLKEFQSGLYAPLSDAAIAAAQVAPVSSYVTFDVKGAEETFTSWSLVLTDSEGISQNFGPYTEESVSIPGKAILGTRPEGTYKVVMTGLTESADTIVKEATTHVVLWTPSDVEDSMQFSVIFDFNESKASTNYKNYIANVVTPMIPQNAKVVINGHADIIGDFDYNQKLSLARANEVKSIIEANLLKEGRKDVKFEVHGFGENEKVSPFGNKFPEERAYNRTVIIDVISPNK